jgi:hypothetical protein
LKEALCAPDVNEFPDMPTGGSAIACGAQPRLEKQGLWRPRGRATFLFYSPITVKSEGRL